jgi:hypothetical protein
VIRNLNTASPVSKTQNSPLRPVETGNTSEKQAALQGLTGGIVGREFLLVKPATTIGIPGNEVAIVTRTSQGFFITHVEGPKFPVINGSTIETRAYRLNERDVIEVAGVKLAFYYK